MFGGNMMGKLGKSLYAPLTGLNRLGQGDIKGFIGETAFGPDAFYGNYWKKQFGLAPPQEEIIVPGGGEQVGYGDYTGGMGASGVSNPYAMLRGR
jgi:hypothetical protein